MTRRSTLHIYLVALLFGACFWVLDGIYEYFYFDDNLRFMLFQEPLTLIDSLVTNVPAHAFFNRLSFLLACLIGALLISRYLSIIHIHQQELIRSRGQLENVLENSPLPMALTKSTGEFLFINKKFVETIGYGHSELRDMDDWWERAFPDPEKRFAARGEWNNATSEAARSDREATLRDWTLRCADGRVRIFEIRYMTIHAQGLMILTDVTEDRRAEEALRQSEEKLRLIVENNPTAVAMLDREMRYMVVSRSWVENLRPRGPEDIIGSGFYETFDGEPPSGCEDMLRRCLLGEPQHCEECYFQRTQGRTECVRWEMYPWYEREGSIGGTIHFMEFITEKKREEEERRRFEGQVQQTQKLESLGVLAGGIAHDFNNLLMAVLGNADMALMELPAASPARASIKEIETASKRAAELCRQMLAYSGKGKFIIEKISLNELVEEMAHLLEISISKKCVLKFSLTKQSPVVQADTTQMRQIVMNLITNASEAIGDRSGVITISTGVMRCDQSYLQENWLVDPLPSGNYAYLQVADTGCGMDQETQDRIFDPFFTTKFTGRGLGMAAVLGIVRGHSGAIKVYSEKNQGTTFKVLFPCASLGALEDAGEEDTPTPWIGDGMILLVDDEETIRRLGARMLKMLGFEVLTARDGRHALEVFRQSQDQVSCVVLDLTMPHMDGEECFRELRRINRDIPVVLSSGYTEQEVSTRFVGKGLTGIIQKPYQMETLRKVLREALSGVQ